MKAYITDIRKILEQARKQAYSSINTAMIEAYWKIGKRIVEEEQKGTERASYGKEIIKNISIELGKGFSERTLRDYRQFYQVFPSWEDLAHACAKLQWSHIRSVMRVSDEKARIYYLQEAVVENWSVRTLDRNISTLKEANKTEYWLELLYQSQYIDSNQYDSIIIDIQELNKNLASIIITSKEKKYGKR